MNNSGKKKPGRPPGNPKRKAIKPNISLRRDLIEEAEAAASKRGMGLSEYVTMALTKQVGRDEQPELHAAEIPVIHMAKSIRSGHA